MNRRRRNSLLMLGLLLVALLGFAFLFLTDFTDDREITKEFQQDDFDSDPLKATVMDPVINAQLEDGTRYEIDADSMNEIKGASRIIEARNPKGQVFFSNETWHIQSQDAIFDLDQNTLILTGDAALFLEGQYDIRAAELYISLEDRIVFSNSSFHFDSYQGDIRARRFSVREDDKKNRIFKFEGAVEGYLLIEEFLK